LCVDGGCRDVRFIIGTGFPVFCRYATPVDSVPRREVVEWGHEVMISDVCVSTGDYVVADADGVVVPAPLKDEVLAKARELAGTENTVRDAVRDGLNPLDAYERFGTF